MIHRNLDGAGDLTTAQAGRADMNGLVRATDNRLHATNVGLPSAVGASMRVGDLAAEADAFSTDIAFCHGFSTSCVVLFIRNEWIIAHRIENCKSILKKSLSRQILDVRRDEFVHRGGGRGGQLVDHFTVLSAAESDGGVGESFLV